MPQGQLSDILNKFHNRKTYQELDRKALDISRKASAGNLGEGDYAEWALINNDPLVMVNSVKTFITVLQARLSSSPFRPKDNKFKEIGEKIRLNSLFTKVYGDVLNDGYAYVSVGISNNMPIVNQVDARYIIFTGEEQTLKDAKDVIIFNIIPKSLDAQDDISSVHIPSEFIEYDESKERCEVSHYHIDDDGIVHLDIYETDDEPRESYTLEGISRIPVIRFVGDEVELDDKKQHYRGIYYLVGSVLKAMALAATKIQINGATFDDANYIAPYDAISNHMNMWINSGVKPYDNVDQNNEVTAPIIPITKNYDFLINSYNTWKSAIDSMLGNLSLESKSEAITEQEVKARNEVRDAITNNYLTKVADSISEVYTVMQALMLQGEEPVIVVGGFLEEAKRNKERGEMMQIYQLAKESGLNVQGFAYELLLLSDMNQEAKQRIQQTFAAAPNNNPLTVQLQQQVQQLTNQIKEITFKKDQEIAMLRTQASQRLERQKDYVQMLERMKRADLAYKQWQEENKEASAARIEAMKSYTDLIKNNIINSEQGMAAVLKLLDANEQRDPLLLAQQEVDNLISESDENYTAVTNLPPVANAGLVRDPQLVPPQAFVPPPQQGGI